MSERLLTAIRLSTPEEKSLVLAELARELFRTHGRGPVAIQDAERRTVGYMIDEIGDSELPFPELTEVEEAELRRRAGTRGPTCTTEELIAGLGRE